MKLIFGYAVGDKKQVTKLSKLLDGSSDFVLTYEDREGDWMLVGDVPWGYATKNLANIFYTLESDSMLRWFSSMGEMLTVSCFCFYFRMFLSSVKRFRIMRTSDANGLGMQFFSKNILYPLLIYPSVPEFF